MIPVAHITAWRARAPWATDAQIEQDLVLSRTLIQIYSDPLLASSLAFRGGTALHKLYLDPPERYSEDLDFVQTQPTPIGQVMEALRATLDPWLGRPRWKQGQGRVTLVYRFESEIAPITPLRVKIEINTREHFSVLGLVSRHFAVESRWFTGSAQVQIYELEELLGTKLRALYQRKKGRDLFDLATALKKQPMLQPSKVVDCFVRYMAHGGHGVTRSEFEANLLAKLADPAFTEDTRALLTLSSATSAAGDTGFEALQAYEEVRRAFIALIPEL